MSVEPKRGCGYRKVGGLYLVSGAEMGPCSGLPIELTVCPTCSAGIKPARGFTWIDAVKLFAAHHENMICTAFYCGGCPVSNVDLLNEKDGLLWVGSQHYETPRDFMLESARMGVSRRIQTVPNDFELGKHWIFLAHREAVYRSVSIVKEIDPVDGYRKYQKEDSFEIQTFPGIFTAFKPERIEKIVTQTESENKADMELLEKRGITPFVVPDDDPDHQ